MKGYQFLEDNFFELCETRNVHRIPMLLYIYLRGLYCRFQKPNFFWNDSTIKKQLGISTNTLTSAKKYLQERGLIKYSSGTGRKDEQGTLKPTRAVVLLFALYPHDIMKTKCTIRVFQYEGTLEKIKEILNLIGTPKTIDGPVVEQIRKAHEYVLTLLRAGMRIPSSGFVTTYRIPERAVKEAITNAVIHRDYYLKRDIEVRIFEDRVEVESPGLFPSNITLYNIGYVRAEGYRNDLLVKHLREFPEPPNLDQNEGVRAMRVEMNRQNLYPPVFLTYPLLQDSVRVVLLNTIRASEWDKVYTYLAKKEKYITNEIVRKIIDNPDTSKVSRLLSKWVHQGLLIRIETGAKKTAKYRLPIEKQ